MHNVDCWSCVVEHMPPQDRPVVATLCKDFEHALCCAVSSVLDDVPFGIYSHRVRILPALRAIGACVCNCTIVYNGNVYLCEAPVGRLGDNWKSFVAALSVRHRTILAAAQAAGQSEAFWQFDVPNRKRSNCILE